MAGGKHSSWEDEEEAQRFLDQLEAEELSPNGIAATNESLIDRQRRYRLAADIATEAVMPFEEVQAVVLFGSVAGPLWKEIPRFRTYRRAGISLWHECSDVDLAVWLSRLDRLETLRRAINKALPAVHERIRYGVAPHELDIFIMEPRRDRYLGRLCGRPPFLKQHAGFKFRPEALALDRAVRLFNRETGEHRPASQLPIQFAEHRPQAGVERQR